MGAWDCPRTGAKIPEINKKAVRNSALNKKRFMKTPAVESVKGLDAGN